MKNYTITNVEECESFKIEIALDDELKVVKAIHSNFKKSIKEQSEKSKDDLVNYILKRIKEGDASGFIPYNNFDSSFSWNVVFINRKK